MTLLSRGRAETERLGAVLGGLLEGGTVVLLSGVFGAGKTALVRGVARGLGIDEPVTSPSFALVNVYDSGRLRLFHLDLYRLEGAGALATVGLEEYCGDPGGVCAIEWAERLEHLAPSEYLAIDLTVRGARRRELRFNAAGARHERLLQELRRAIGA
ncbi:MAG: tRNA (adenosine(37)-N6)-threonylcarbamoyltransferase complex ATPase subunit type 1 TsaE [Chloroflexi bacterium]|nr:tRNA (adenosine(37)-N6)-threonylcarbamoyltransferase complex ATPase subunit type 1 TsaE [Chloroflexota bacterium]